MDCATKTFAWHTVWDDVGCARLEYAELARAFPGRTVCWAVEGAWSFADVLGVARSDAVQTQYDPQLLDLEFQAADDVFRTWYRPLRMVDHHGRRDPVPCRGHPVEGMVVRMCR
ncbi:hypothetical protein GCM10009648_29410 [Tsukamurella spumae]